MPKEDFIQNVKYAIGPVDALMALLDHLRTGTPMSPDCAEFLAEGIERFCEASGEISLDRALKMRQRGGVSLKRAEELANRDQLLVELWTTHEDFRGHPPIAAAKLMSAAARRYEGVRWPREQGNSSPPAGKAAATWWQILQSGQSIPASKRLQQILECSVSEYAAPFSEGIPEG